MSNGELGYGRGGCTIHMSGECSGLYILLDGWVGRGEGVLKSRRGKYTIIDSN